MLTCHEILKAGHWEGKPEARAVLAHDERHLRRKVIAVEGGARLLVDLPAAAALEEGDALVLDGGGLVEVKAADEELYEVRARSPAHLSELAWHLGNRHLAARIETDRIFILRDHVIAAMLEGLGAVVREMRGPFAPLRGAYHQHGADGGHHRHHHHHGHDEGAGEGHAHG
jgi:urease accessory protein